MKSEKIATKVTKLAKMPKSSPTSDLVDKRRTNCRDDVRTTHSCNNVWSWTTLQRTNRMRLKLDTSSSSNAGYRGTRLVVNCWLCFVDE